MNESHPSPDLPSSLPFVADDEWLEIRAELQRAAPKGESPDLDAMHCSVLTDLIDWFRRAGEAAPTHAPDSELLRSIQELTGEANTLAGILRDCDAVLATLEPDDADEAEKLADLRLAIIYALDPYKREGTLL